MNTETNWNNINWTEMEKELAIMQDNIVMTTIEFGANSSNVEEAQKLLIKSDVGRIMAARKVITNPGSKTAGIDGITLSKEDLGTVIKQLKNIRGYQCKPVKRVYIPKNDGVNKRPLGIPCSIDRA
jgi:RNA-directed DNA polymerase